MYLVLILLIVLIGIAVWSRNSSRRAAIYVDLARVCSNAQRLNTLPRRPHISHESQFAKVDFEVDDAVVNKMLHSGLKNKTALDNRALWNKNTFEQFHASDLRDQAESVWWEDYSLYY